MTEKFGVLTREDIEALLKNKPPLVDDAFHLAEQIQPNGIDLTLRDISTYETPGILTDSNEGRKLSKTKLLTYDESGAIDIKPGAYLVTFNEIVNLPTNIMALGRPRSSLNRCGVSIHSAVWDAGYTGRSQSMLVVYNVNGFKLYKNARIMQLVFMYTSQSVAKGYSGKYQQENI
jgi:dUTP pyrophosphatase